MTVWEAYTRTATGERTGSLQLLDGSQFTVRFNAVGAYTLQTPFTDDAWDRLQPGYSVEIRRRGRHACGGPIVGLEWVDRFDEGTGAYESVITVEGVTDEIHLADRITYPDAARAGTDQTTVHAWSMTSTAAETIMCRLVDQQLGPAARAERRVAGLSVAASQGRGPIRGMASRFGVVLDHLQGLAVSGGLGFRVVPTTEGTRFEVYRPDDRTGAVRYGVNMGNVAEQAFRSAAPPSTYWLAGGGGESTLRVFRERTASSEWGRRTEQFIDARDTTDTAELDDRLLEAEAEAIPERSYVVTPIDTGNARLLEDVQLGDRVTVYAGPRASKRRFAFTDLVREIRGDLSGDTDTLTAAVGSEGASTGVPLPSTQLLVKLAARLRALEGSA